MSSYVMAVNYNRDKKHDRNMSNFIIWIFDTGSKRCFEWAKARRINWNQQVPLDPAQ